MLRSIGKQSRKSVETVWKKKSIEGKKDLQKRKILSPEWNREGVTDDESSESTEPMKEVPLKELASQNWRD